MRGSGAPPFSRSGFSLGPPSKAGGGLHSGTYLHVHPKAQVGMLVSSGTGRHTGAPGPSPEVLRPVLRKRTWGWELLRASSIPSTKCEPPCRVLRALGWGRVPWPELFCTIMLPVVGGCGGSPRARDLGLVLGCSSALPWPSRTWRSPQATSSVPAVPQGSPQRPVGSNYPENCSLGLQPWEKLQWLSGGL